MNNGIRKVLSCFFAILMLVSLAHASVFAEDTNGLDSSAESVLFERNETAGSFDPADDGPAQVTGDNLIENIVQAMDAEDGDEVLLDAVIGDDYQDMPNYPIKSSQKDSITDPWGFLNRECTSFVAWRLNSQNNIPFKNQNRTQFSKNACNKASVQRI